MENKKIYNEIVKLRKNINIIKYLELKEKNKNDRIYGWAFNNDDVIFEKLVELKRCDNENYISEVLSVYYELLLNCQADKLTSKNNYKTNKQILRNQAINWVNWDKTNISYYDLSIINNYFRKNAKKYGLLQEFTENGII